MTRWARSGNTQKHKKMPGDATPWEEFSTASKMKTASKGGNMNQVLKGRIEKKKHKLKRAFGQGDSKKFVKQNDFQSAKTYEATDLIENETSESRFSKKRNSSNSSENGNFEIVDISSPVRGNVSTNNIQQDQSRKISSNVEPENKTSPSPEITSAPSAKVLNKRQLQKAKSKLKNITKDNLSSSMVDDEVIKNMEINLEAESANVWKDFETKKNDLKVGSNDARTTKVLSKRQLKKAKRIKALNLNVPESERVDFKVVDTQETKDVTKSHISSPTILLGKNERKNSEKNRRNQEIISENTVDVSLNENKVEIMDQEDKTQKSTNNCVETLNNEVLSKSETSQVNDLTEVKKLTKKQWKKARQKRKFELLKAKQAIEGKEIKSENQIDKKSPTSIADKDFEGKRKLFLEKLERKRPQDGTTPLPSKVERKIFNIKKTLSEKGLSANKIRDIVRKERKRENLKFKRTYSNKPCFNCRKIGHFLSECPLPLGESTQVTGVCFKCGSTEHTSYKCQKRVEGYPLAKCFICKEQGHISKDCPKNEHGVYINGGKCSLCGNVNHLSKDCPSNKKVKDNVVTIDTINEGMSVDAEMIESGSSNPKKHFPKKKVVKF